MTRRIVTPSPLARPVRRPIDRRTVLRGLLGGAAATVALPTLDAMLNGNGTAYAATGLALPDRFGVWFWGNGNRPAEWTPSGSGPWTPSTELAPLADVVSYVSVVTGCEIKTSDYPHHGGMTGIMTGEHYLQLGTTRDTIVSTFARQSVDMDAADWFDGTTGPTPSGTPFRSLEVGITTFRGTDEGSTFQHLSHNGPNNPNPAEYSPSALYERLFAVPLDPQIDLARQSVLDAVAGQAERLKTRLGARDLERLEQHLDSIRTLEQRLAAGVTACEPGTPPTDVADLNGNEQIALKNDVMSEVLALALACDLTRAFSVLFSTCGSGVVVSEVGAADSLHYICHTEALPQPTVHAATTFEMEQLAAFLRKLRDTPEGAGSLLDRCSILCTSELSDGWAHEVTEFPILIAGLGGGRLKGGVHYRSIAKRNTSDAVLTALHGAGVTLSRWGVDDGYTTSTISELLV